MINENYDAEFQFQSESVFYAWVEVPVGVEDNVITFFEEMLLLLSPKGLYLFRDCRPGQLPFFEHDFRKPPKNRLKHRL